ncbi:MAG: tetratricopeptide repeat protein [candidate division WOR-3 bacterium]|nr:tetratricopeptide repeat protein [candidate division WOR-3 bacterium]
MNDDFQDLLEISEFYILSQKYEEAIKTLKKAQKINNREPKLYYNLGIAYEALNDRDKAINAFRQALSLDPNFQSAREHLDRLIKG